MNDQSPLLVVDNLRKVYTRGVLKKAVTFQLEADFTIAEPAIVGMMGPNGSGKTTLFELITGSNRPNRGKVFCLGHDIHQVKYRERDRLAIHYHQSYQVRHFTRTRPSFMLESAATSYPMIHLFDEPQFNTQDGYIGFMLDFFHKLHSQGRLVFVCLHPNEPVHLEIMREICQNYIFVYNGRLIHLPDFDTLIANPQVGEYLGHLTQNIMEKKMIKDNQKLALLTGAAGVLGSATARGLIADGYRVVMVDIDGNQLEALSRELGTGAHPLVLDVADPQKVAEACATIRQELGQVSVLVNNAGVLSNNKAAETANDEWRHILAVNLDGAFYLCREWLPGMKDAGWGRIINVCSLAMKTGGITAGTAYTTSKGAMASLTFSLAREAASCGVTVNGIAPAYIKTPMVTRQLTEEQRRQLLDQIPVGRFCEAEEVAHVVRFLVSPLSGFITGEIVDINGGLHMD